MQDRRAASGLRSWLPKQDRQHHKYNSKKLLELPKMPFPYPFRLFAIRIPPMIPCLLLNNCIRDVRIKGKTLKPQIP